MNKSLVLFFTLFFFSSCGLPTPSQLPDKSDTTTASSVSCSSDTGLTTQSEGHDEECPHMDDNNMMPKEMLEEAKEHMDEVPHEEDEPHDEKSVT